MPKTFLINKSTSSESNKSFSLLGLLILLSKDSKPSFLPQYLQKYLIAPTLKLNDCLHFKDLFGSINPFIKLKNRKNNKLLGNHFAFVCFGFISSFSSCNVSRLFGTNQIISGILKVLRRIVLVLFLNFEVFIDVDNIKTLVAFLCLYFDLFWVYFIG